MAVDYERLLSSSSLASSSATLPWESGWLRDAFGYMTPEARSLAGIFITRGNLESLALKIDVEEDDDDKPSGAA
eukprot:5519752-Heterocapsa_arctica.AAC.1